MQYINPYVELCLEGSSSIFKGLNQKDKETLVHHHTLTVFKKGQFLFKEGDKTHGLICYKTLFSYNLWSVSAIAIEDSAICIFEKSSFIRILKKNPDLSMKFIKVIADELWFSNNRTVSLTQKHVRGRLAESILILRDTYGFEADGKTIRISLSREDIANLSNMTTSNAIRTLSNLASEGIIEITGRRISIIDSNQIELISELG